MQIVIDALAVHGSVATADGCADDERIYGLGVFFEDSLR